MQKKAIVTVINDLTTDQRVARICDTLEEEGYEVLLIGRQLRKSPPLPDRPYRMIRMKLPFEKGPLFYFSYMCSLFFLLLRKKGDLIWANDLDTLGAAYLASRWKKTPLIYDSHELFTEVPELEGRRFKKAVWKKLERSIIPKLPFMLTVNPSIAEKYREEYNVKVHVLPNYPDPPRKVEARSRKALDLPEERFIAILQGSGINLGRGGEEALAAIERTEGVMLLVIGGGDRYEEMKEQAKALIEKDRARFLPRMPYEKMMQYTRNADIGLSLDQPISENYRLSTPNKLFDYIQAGIPVLASDLPEVSRVIREYQVGELSDPQDPDRIAQRIQSMKEDPETLEEYRKNAREAARTLNWENGGKPVVQKVLDQLEA